MSLRSLFVDLFSRAVGRRRRQDVARPSERKPQHSHESRRARRMLGRPWVGTPMQWRRDGQLHAQRLYGDPRTTGRLETSSERRRRRTAEARCRAGRHLWSPGVLPPYGEFREHTHPCVRDGCGARLVVEVPA